jgi:hypothetical protein
MKQSNCEMLYNLLEGTFWENISGRRKTNNVSSHAMVHVIPGK